jgi:hypothetical protein
MQLNVNIFVPPKKSYFQIQNILFQIIMTLKSQKY